MDDAGLIDPTRFPGGDVDPEAVRQAADGLAGSAAEVRQGGADVVAAWRRLAQFYEASEAHRLLHAMDPVERDSGRFADDLDGVARALHRFADDVGPALDLRRMVTIEAEWFLAIIAGDADWRMDQRLVDQHMRLLGSANEVQVLLWDAERRCANAIRELCGGDAWRASTGADDPRGHGWASIPEAAEMPWGAPVQRQDQCAKAAFVQVKRFVWDGIVWDGVMGALKGVVALGGVGDETDGSWGWSHSWSAAGETWSGVAALLGHDDGGWSAGTAGEAWLEMGKGLLSWDSWADDPGRASGGAVFNVVSLAVPFVGAAKAVSVLGNAGRAGAGARAVVAAVDPAEVADDVAADVAQAGPARVALAQLDEALEAPSEALGGPDEVVLAADEPLGPRPPDGQVVADWSVRATNAPKAPKEFLTPTNPPQPPPRFIPEGWSLRVMDRSDLYPDGYWVLRDEGGQAIDIGIGKHPASSTAASFRAKTHVPLPPDWIDGVRTS